MDHAKDDFKGAIKDYSEAIRLKPDYAAAVESNYSIRNGKSQARSTRIAITRSCNPEERSEDIATPCPISVPLRRAA